MYIIIGGDGKEYGPVSGEDVRKWIAEGRLNAQSLVKAESDAEFRPLATFPEFADALAPQAPPPGASPVFSPASLAEGDYDLDIGGCVSRGWTVTTSHFGQVFLPFLVYFLIEIAIGVLGKIPFIGFVFSIGSLFVTGPLMAGLFYVILLAAREQPAGMERMFDGFRSGYWQLFLGYFVPAVAYLLCLAPFLVVYFVKVFPMLDQMQRMTPTDMESHMAQVGSALLGSLPVFLICLVPVIYLSINWQFTLPLIIDKKLDFWTAMKTSWKRVHKHWFAVFGLVVIVMLLNILGLLVCCIGLLFTIPLGFAMLMCAYETIFSGRPGR